MKRRISLFAFTAILGACSSATTTTPESASSTSAALSAGAPLETWNGVTAYVQGGKYAAVYATSGTDAHYGPPGVFTDSAGFQCVELAVRYLHFKEGIPAGGWAGLPDAISMCDRHPSGVVKVANPGVGDLMVYKANDSDPNYATGPAGHVAIVRGIRGDGLLDVFNQNWGGESTAFVSGIDRAHAACFLHATSTSGGGAPNGTGTAAGRCTATEMTNTTANGAHWWTCEAGKFRYICDGGGQKVREACPNGCVGEGIGKDDQCSGGGQPKCTAAEIVDQGGSGPSYWTCQGRNRYVCDFEGNKVTEACASGCASQGVGRDDTCK